MYLPPRVIRSASAATYTYCSSIGSGLDSTLSFLAVSLGHRKSTALPILTQSSRCLSSTPRKIESMEWPCNVESAESFWQLQTVCSKFLNWVSTSSAYVICCRSGQRDATARSRLTPPPRRALRCDYLIWVLHVPGLRRIFYAFLATVELSS